MATKRDDMYRCKICKQLYLDSQCERDSKTGAFICPKGCVEPFVQPPYQSPLISDVLYEDQ